MGRRSLWDAAATKTIRPLEKSVVFCMMKISRRPAIGKEKAPVGCQPYDPKLFLNQKCTQQYIH